MSEGKRESGGQGSDKVKVEIGRVAHAKLHAIKNRTSPKTRKSFRSMVGDMIHVLHDLEIDPAELRDYMEKAKKKMEDAPDTELIIPENACPGLVIITAGDKKEYYNCVRGSDKGTVKIKKMTRYMPQAIKICESCVWRISLEKRWAEIQKQDRYGLEEHTYCSKGEEIDPETNKIKCQMMGRALGRTWFDQEDCFTVDEGRKCPNLKTLPAKEIKKTGITRRR